ncbi:MAG: ABC transporter permease [candidate division KSB1 bacterium]|nr:ABC transporter permease [candidate division KSB1 bacterium]MDZ7305337.1 ABC transporter permease [candidate division KSB1 bacterium]MDZ7313382.1 ABC transporter permease [candidate division KSB1 bacterium]
MLKNYLKIALRSFLRHKIYSAINLAGLGLGVAVCILILLFVRHEWSHDRYHRNAARIYLVTSAQSTSPSRFAQTVATPALLAPKLMANFPEIIQTVRFLHQRDAVLRYDDRLFKEERFYFGDASVFEVFSFPLLAGDPKTALREPNTLVLTEKAAKKYFGDENPIGKILSLDGQGEFKVTGVLQEIPTNSQFVFDFLASFATLGEITNPYKYFGTYTYLLLPENYPAKDLEEKFAAHREELAWYLDDLYFKLEPLTKIHLNPALSSSMDNAGDIRYVYMFSVIAILILLIACSNYLNLATARSTLRAREVGIRKVLGAERLRLAKQFLGEAILFSLFAFMFALVLVELFLPVFNRLVEKSLHIDYVHDLGLLLALGGFALMVGIVTGSYPALLLSAFRPIHVLKGIFPTGSSRRTALTFRRILVVAQFTISIALIAGTMIIGRQLQYIRHHKLGFEKEHIVSLYIRNTPILQNHESFKAELLQHPGILKASVASGSPFDGVFIAPYKIGETEVELHYVIVDYDYLETLGMKLVAGRNFSRNQTTDAENTIILNETAVKMFDLQSPLGREFSGMDAKRTIIGVVEDFHSASLHEPIQPTVLHIFPRNYRSILVRLRPENIPATMAFLERKWREFAPNRPFDYAFLDQKFDRLYRAEEKLATIFGYFAGIAIVIACLGLFGLAAFATEQRTKEIGVRKVLGATVMNVVALFSKDFAKLVLLANLLAWPIGWYAMHRWLQNFAYRIDIGWWVFVLAGGLALVIALVTVSTQAFKAALANPVEALRYE